MTVGMPQVRLTYGSLNASRFRMISAADFVRDTDAIDYSTLVIQPEYIDANGHLNVGYYGVIFDKATDLPWAKVGMTAARIASDGKTTFVLESHLTFQREILESDPMTFTFRVLDVDEKRVHYFLEMKHATGGWVAATLEQISMCVDVAARRATSARRASDADCPSAGAGQK